MVGGVQFDSSSSRTFHVSRSRSCSRSSVGDESSVHSVFLALLLQLMMLR